MVICVEHFVDIGFGEFGAAAEFGHHPSTQRKMTFVNPQQDVGSVTGYIFGIVAGLVYLAFGGAPGTFHRNLGIKIENEFVIGMFQDCGEYFKEATGAAVLLG
jgi:hypothetical protein